jgi:hypothetical protein
MSNNHIETAQQIVTQLSQGDFVGAWQRAESNIAEEVVQDIASWIKQQNV